MKSLKEYFKARLMEDLGSPELMQNIIKREADTNRDMSDLIDRVAKSPHLYVPDPNNPSKPMRVPGARLSPELTGALTQAAMDNYPLTPEHSALIKDFIDQHGHVVGSDPQSPYGSIDFDTSKMGRLINRPRR